MVFATVLFDIVFLDNNDFVFAVAAAVPVVVNFESADFVTLAAAIDAAAVHASFVDFFSAVAEIVVVNDDTDLTYSGNSNSSHFRGPSLVAVALEVTVVGRF